MPHREDHDFLPALFVPVQVLDGFARTRDNVAGRLVELFREAGFEEAAERRRFATIMGTMTLYSARRGR